MLRDVRLYATTVTALSCCMQCLLYMLSHNVLIFSSAPSAAPSDVIISEVTASTIIVQWTTVPCVHHNRDIITGYSVRYGKSDESENNIETVFISGNNITLSGLTSSTLYIISVAAVNIDGIGVYSRHIVKTISKCI